jgi:5-formyltetrahydrofolate cyclo-ligase
VSADGGDKRALRRALLAARAALPPDVRARAAGLLGAAVAPLTAVASQVAAYVPVGAEPAADGLLVPGVLLPVLLPDGDLDWAVYDGRLEAGPRGLRQPAGPRLGRDAVAGCDLVVVPALAVGRDGGRLGRGGGSYDRALARVTGRTVALLHDGELRDRVPTEPHDRRVTAAATPSGGLVALPSSG